jgi:hypothetical protein
MKNQVIVIAGASGGEQLRDATWVLVEEVKSGAWGIGGKPSGLPELRAIQAGGGAIV